MTLLNFVALSYEYVGILYYLSSIFTGFVQSQGYRMTLFTMEVLCGCKIVLIWHHAVSF